MICSKCGREFNEGVFCPYCGEKHSESESAGDKNSSKVFHGIGTKAIVIAAAVVAILIIVLACYVSYDNKPINKLSSLFGAESYDEAGELYHEVKGKLNSDEKNKVLSSAVSAAEDVFGKYSNGDIEYEVALYQLNSLKQIDLAAAKIDSIIAQTESINTSQAEFTAAENFFESADYASAITHYKNVIEGDKNYSAAVSKLEEAINLYRTSVISETEKYEKEQQYEEALRTVKQGLDVLKNDEELRTCQIRIEDSVETARELELLDDIKSCKGKGNLEEAIKLANAYNGDNKDILSLKEQIEAEYSESLIVSIKEMITNGDVDGAKKALQDADRLAPSNERIDDWLNSIDSYYPVLITEENLFLHNSEGNVYDKGDWVKEKDFDNLGNTDYVGMKYEVWARKSTPWEENTYTIDGKYNRLSGVLSIIKDTVAKDAKAESYAKISVYGDGVCLYTSEPVKDGVYPIDFSVDITNVKELKLRIDAHGDMYFAILNPYLRKLPE